MPKRGRFGMKDPKAVDHDIWSLLVSRNPKISVLCIVLFASLIRVSVSLHPYSGAGTPPKYGDFEAQRHWMEITVNLPVMEWYRNSTTNDLDYWGLDYPPLSAYQSYVHGLILRHFHPDSVSILTSRGHESYLGKLLMRWTVLFSDTLIFFPAVIYFATVYYRSTPIDRKDDMAWHIALILLNPCLILIDHGHFQYNCISLGLCVGAAAAILSGRDLVACILFSLALNHKQMSLYYAPAFFSYLLGKCFRKKYPLLEVSKLGVVVVATFAAVWWPYLHSADDFWAVLHRLAPFERGIYEDYVANFWCTTSIVVKWKKLFALKSLKLLSFFLTISTCLPSMIQQIWSPSNRGFLYGMLNSAFSFYLFSFQVHEKSILLPLLPASLLALKEPLVFSWLARYAMLSMLPLLCRDKLIIPYIALFGLFTLICHTPGRRCDTRRLFAPVTLRSFAVACLVLYSVVLHVMYLTMQPPDKYPFLFEATIMLFCFPQFTLLTVYTNAKQWMLLKHTDLKEKEKKLV